MFEKMSVEQYCQSLASSSPTPGGGSALAFVGAIACSLVEMSASVTLAKPQTINGDADYLTMELASITRARKCLYKLSDDDASCQRTPTNKANGELRKCKRLFTRLRLCR